MSLNEILYWVEEDNILYSFKSKAQRDKYVKDSDIVLRNQFVPDGLRVFETKTIFSGVITKYEIM